MPKATFNGLPIEKKERVLTAATDLFAQRDFTGRKWTRSPGGREFPKVPCTIASGVKNDLFLYVCNLGTHGVRESVWRTIPSDWDIYLQVEELFRRQVSLILEHPQNFQIYLNLASSGMKKFAGRYTREGEESEAKRLKDRLRRMIESGIVREDLDVPYTVFMINSLSIIFMASPISGHFQVRFTECLEIEGERNRKKMEEHLERILRFIHHLLRLGGPRSETNRQEGIHV